MVSPTINTTGAAAADEDDNATMDNDVVDNSNDAVAADDEDDELQAAIALSMQNNNSTGTEVEINPATILNRNDDIIATTTGEGNLKSPAGVINDGDEFDCRSFQKLMWDDATTTNNDKERWIYECISTPSLQNMGGNKSSLPSTAAVAAGVASANQTMDDDAPLTLTPLEIFTGSSSANGELQQQQQQQQQQSPHQLWGLTQKHGGPCGVLAALQAEMIRILLFGRGGHCRDLYFPFSPSSFDNYNNCEASKIAVGEVEEALAMAIGMILARAALMPRANIAGGQSHDGGRTDSVQLVLPESSNTQHLADQSTASQEEKSHESSMSWIHEMLRSPSQSMGNNNPSGLKVHSIVVSDDKVSATTTSATVTNSNNRNVDEDDDASSSPEMKRPRSGSTKQVLFSLDNSNDFGTSSNTNESTTQNTLSLEQKKMTALARAVADFLLSTKGAEQHEMGSDSTMAAATAVDNESSSNSGKPAPAAAGKAPLEFFQGPGGVMFLVMSLVETRGIDRIRCDMDDSNTTITSQFGHSSQELMNLLLTGQAVSNVFDNSMVLSEELSCHGIQSRPAIGYLSILESLRYCEVGGYYKSPLFPIWVVGSTSHFSVLFGDERCLKESKSDILLEKIRRAFKKVEGGGENGFILVDKLGDVLDELDLRTNVGGDSGVQTLQAYLEVSGAGIILWDDFWKASSRLMTGSSLEMVMSSQDDFMLDGDDGNDGPPLLITQFGQDDDEDDRKMPATTTPAPQSDEELAKKLAAEWGSMPDPIVVDQSTKSDEDYARELQAQWDAEVEGTSAATDIIDLSSQAATTDDVATLASETLPETKKEAEEGGKGMDATMDEADDQSQSKPEQLDFEKHGVSFPLYHYNGLSKHGLHGGTLTPFRLTRLSPTEAVGASIALSSKGGSGHGAGGGDLEDVVRTKWPSSMLNWFGKNPPSID